MIILKLRRINTLLVFHPEEWILENAVHFIYLREEGRAKRSKISHGNYPAGIPLKSNQNIFDGSETEERK
jgi:hypothetical protein